MIQNPYQSSHETSDRTRDVAKRRTLAKNFLSFIIVAVVLVLIAPQPQNASGNMAYAAILSSALVTVTIDAFATQRWYWTIALIATLPITLTVAFMLLRPILRLLNGANYWELHDIVVLCIAGVIASGLSIGLSALDVRYST